MELQAIHQSDLSTPKIKGEKRSVNISEIDRFFYSKIQLTANKITDTKLQPIKIVTKFKDTFWFYNILCRAVIILLV